MPKRFFGFDFLEDCIEERVFVSKVDRPIGPKKQQREDELTLIPLPLLRFIPRPQQLLHIHLLPILNPLDDLAKESDLRIRRPRERRVIVLERNHPDSLRPDQGEHDDVEAGGIPFFGLRRRVGAALAVTDEFGHERAPEGGLCDFGEGVRGGVSSGGSVWLLGLESLVLMLEALSRGKVGLEAGDGAAG